MSALPLECGYISQPRCADFRCDGVLQHASCNALVHLCSRSLSATRVATPSCFRSLRVDRGRRQLARAAARGSTLLGSRARRAVPKTHKLVQLAAPAPRENSLLEVSARATAPSTRPTARSARRVPPENTDRLLATVRVQTIVWYATSVTGVGLGNIWWEPLATALGRRTQ